MTPCFSFKKQGNDLLCSNCKAEKIITHKTYLVLGNSPKFHIESLGRTFFWRNPHFWDLDVECTKRNFPSSRCFLALEPCLRRDYFFPLLFPSPQRSRQNVRVLFSLAHRPKDPGPNSCILVDWAWFTAAKWGLITNQVVRKSHKSPQGKNAIPPKQ